MNDIALTEQRGLCSISCFTCLYLGLDKASTESLRQLVLGEVIEGSSWQQEFEVPSYPGRVLSSAPAGWLEVDVANGSARVKRREQLVLCREGRAEVLLCKRGLLPPQTWECFPSQSVRL